MGAGESSVLFIAASRHLGQDLSPFGTLVNNSSPKRQEGRVFRAKGAQPEQRHGSGEQSMTPAGAADGSFDLASPLQLRKWPLHTTKNSDALIP